MIILHNFMVFSIFKVQDFTLEGREVISGQLHLYILVIKHGLPVFCEN